jgi:hypothetical protein
VVKLTSKLSTYAERIDSSVVRELDRAERLAERGFYTEAGLRLGRVIEASLATYPEHAITTFTTSKHARTVAFIVNASNTRMPISATYPEHTIPLFAISTNPRFFGLC